MLRPPTIAHQYYGKAHAEALRGSGLWPLQPHPCNLEPPCEDYHPRAVSVWDCMVNDWEGPWEGSWLRKMLSAETPLHRVGEPPVLPELPCVTYEDLRPIIVEQFCEDETTVPKMQQFLMALPAISRPVSFEVVGLGPQPKWDIKKSKEIIESRGRGEKRHMREAICGWEEPYTLVQFVAHESDATQVQSQLVAHYPNSAIVVGDSIRNAVPDVYVDEDSMCAATLSLDNYYCYPLRIFGKLDPDPLGVAIAAMEELDKDQWALLQVLFQPTRYNWNDILMARNVSMGLRQLRYEISVAR